jgi:hypothetical protein
MSFQRVLQKMTTALDQAGVAYMLTGSFASAYHGFASGKEPFIITRAIAGG